MLTLEPSELIRAASRLTELVFSHEYGNIPWLLVRIAPGDHELAAGLHVTDANAAAVRPPGQLAFHTEALNEAPFRSKNDDSARSDADRASLIRSLGDERYHVVPVSKRTDVDAVFGERVSLGRALNKDIVLRHTSISKFHAYFHQSEPDHCVLSDADSKNGTVVNGTRLRPKEPVEVASGDRVMFGSISTVVLDARALWRVLRSR
jgi:FHA domain